jgi:hypothetical protein
MRRYIVTVTGWEPEIFEAETSAGAKAKAFRALREAGTRLTFRDFLGRVSVRPHATVH